MIRVLLLVLASLVVAPAARADGVNKAAAQKVALPKRFSLKPPKSFRPSDTIDRLADVFASMKGGRYTFHAQAYPAMSAEGQSLMIHTTLLESKDPIDKANLTHVLKFAKSYGFSIHAEGGAPEHDALREALAPHGAAELVATPKK